MLKTFSGLAVVTLGAALTLQGCYRSVLEDRVGPDGGAGTDAGAGADARADAAADGAANAGPAAPLDFGADPSGAAALSTLSCPELTMPAASLTATVYVDANATGPEAGTKAAPFRTIAKAFGSAGPKGVIWVAAGMYPEQLIVPAKDLTLLGGFAPGFAGRTNACATVLEAPNANAPTFAAPSSVKSFTMEGLTVQKAMHAVFVLGDLKDPGTFTIARCVFQDNGSPERQGGAVVLDGVNARIFRSVFRNNRATKGAAVASNGKVTLTVDQNLFDHNLGYADHGGALYLSAQKTKISRNTFRSNATGVGIPGGGGWGGAVIVYSNSLTEIAKADFSFNVFTDNLAGIGGGVFVDDAAVVTMSHDLFYRNRSYPESGFLRGSAIYVDGTGFAEGGSTFTAEYLTVANNDYDDKGAPATSQAFGGNVYVEGFSKATFTNSIFWNNGANAFYVAGGPGTLLTVDNSIGASGCTTANAEQLIAADPSICAIGAGVFLPAAIDFGDEAADDYHEQSTAGRFSKGAWVLDAVTSPAIDRADPAAPVGSEPAPNGGRANLGAFAGTSEASKSP